MGDLEDKILKKNIPGKYTWWEKDSDEEGASARADWVDREGSDPEAEMTEMEKQRKWIENDCPEPIKRTIMARQEKERARTGVKGVLADFDAWKLSADAEDFLAKEYRAAMLKRMTQGHTLSTSSEAAASLKSGAQNGSGSDSDFDNDDGGDEAFLGKYRQRRLEQLKATAGRPQFGQIAEVERASFVKAVDTEDPRTTVVVHLYEPYIEACRRMNRFLEVLAVRQPTVKFLRLRSTAAEGGDYDLVALPTLLLYRAGEVVGCFTRVTDDLGENFTQEDVEWLLQEHDVFEVSQALVEKTEGGEHGPHKMATRHRGGEDLDDFGDDDDGDDDDGGEVEEDGG